MNSEKLNLNAKKYKISSKWSGVYCFPNNNLGNTLAFQDQSITGITFHAEQLKGSDVILQQGTTIS